MQYNYSIKKDINENTFIEFSSRNDIHGYNYYGKDFLNNLLSTISEIEPSLNNDDNFCFFEISNINETSEEEIKEKFEDVFNPDWEGDKVKKLVIETIKGKVFLEENIFFQIILTSENNSELIKEIDSLLRKNC